MLITDAVSFAYNFNDTQPIAGQNYCYFGNLIPIQNAAQKK